MRVAICMSGLPREIAATWRSFVDNVVVNFPAADVFIHTGAHYPYLPEFFDSINLKAYAVESQYNFDAQWQTIHQAGFHDIHAINGLVQQFYGWKRVCEMKQMYERHKCFRYDLVMRTRPDLIFLRPITVDLIDPTSINNLHAPFAPSMAIEFAIGPNDLMEKYFGLFDWLPQEGPKWLTKENPRIHIHPAWGGVYNGDLIMATYLQDALGIKLADQKLPAEAPCPYKHYRIMNRHKLNQY